MTQPGRYCPPKICWCGECAWYKPNPYKDPNSPQSIALSKSLRRKAKTHAKRMHQMTQEDEG